MSGNQGNCNAQQVNEDQDNLESQQEVVENCYKAPHEKVGNAKAKAENSESNPGNINPKFFDIEAVCLRTPEVFKRILEYSVGENEDPDLQLKTVRAIRLVQKLWTNELAHLKRSTKTESLYHLKLEHENSINGEPYVQADGKLLDQFVELSETRVEERVPPFRITLQQGFFRAENYDSLAACFRSCGSELREMMINFPIDGGSLPGVYSNDNLSALRNLKVVFTADASPPNPANSKEKAIGFLSSLLTNNKTLKFLEFLSAEGQILSQSLGYLILPVSLRSLKIDSVQLAFTLDLLCRNHLPHLECLKLFVANQDDVDEVKFFKAISKIRKTLKFLVVDRSKHNEQPRTRNFIRFPVLPVLEQLYIEPKYLDLADNHDSPAKCFPKLKFMRYDGPLEPFCLKWVSSTEYQFSSVTHICLLFVGENNDAPRSEFVYQITEEHMHLVSRSFPNLTKLALLYNASQQDASALTCIFREMQKLTALHLKICGTAGILDEDFFDSIFTGVPQEIVHVIKTRRDFWNKFELKDNLSSIRNLTELKTLYLCDNGGGQQSPLTSDFSFVFAFLKMKKLTYLKFCGRRLLASTETTEMWRNMQRKIDQINHD